MTHRAPPLPVDRLSDAAVAAGRCIHVSANALVRFRERGDDPAAALLDDVALRLQLEGRLDRAARAARSIGACDYLIVCGDLAFVVRDGTVTTVLTACNSYERQKLLRVETIA